MNEKLLRIDGTLAHYWYIDSDYIGRCKKCLAIKPFPPSREDEKLREWQINPKKKGRKVVNETETVELYA